MQSIYPPSMSFYYFIPHRLFRIPLPFSHTITPFAEHPLVVCDRDPFSHFICSLFFQQLDLHFFISGCQLRLRSHENVKNVCLYPAAQGSIVHLQWCILPSKSSVLSRMMHTKRHTIYRENTLGPHFVYYMSINLSRLGLSSICGLFLENNRSCLLTATKRSYAFTAS